MSISINTQPVPIAPDSEGVLRVGGTRISLDSVIYAFYEGATPEEIVQQYDSLNLADTYAVIGYYLNNRSDIDSYLENRRDERDRIQQEIEAQFDPISIRDRLIARRKKSNS